MQTHCWAAYSKLTQLCCPAMFLRMNFLAEVADSRHHTLNFSLHYVSIFAVPELASSVITAASTWLRLSVSPNYVVFGA